MRILLVEDSRPIEMANKRALTKAGYEVICAEDGETALTMAQCQGPDLILLDLLLPGMGGLEVLRELKNSPLTVKLPVIVVSSLSAKNGPKLIEAGAEDYIEKNTIMDQGRNRLPEMLLDIIARINRKRGTFFLTVPLPQ